MKFISQRVDVAAWLSLRSLPPKEAMEALVVTDMAGVDVRVGVREGYQRMKEDEEEDETRINKDMVERAMRGEGCGDWFLHRDHVVFRSPN